MRPQSVTDLSLDNQRVIVRMDLDVDPDGKDLYRLEACLPTLEYLAEKKCKVVIIGHRGRPGGKSDVSLSLKPVAQKLEELLRNRIGKDRLKKLDMNVAENLRFNSGEESNDDDFAKHLAELGDYYINEAFSVSHREHASVVGVPRYVKGSALGLRFAEEISNLDKVLNKPERPILVILSGAKEDKLEHISPLKNLADTVLIAGRLPLYMGEIEKDSTTLRVKGSDDKCKVVIANLIQDKEDITLKSAEIFEQNISSAGTIVVSGPVGKFEEDGHRQGTEKVLNAVAKSGAYKVAGGGETSLAIDLLGLEKKFDWISVGGGAMLEYLTEGTLPGIKAIKSK
jgi:phosphoglycerate kinase